MRKVLVFFFTFSLATGVFAQVTSLEVIESLDYGERVAFFSAVVAALYTGHTIASSGLTPDEIDKTISGLLEYLISLGPHKLKDELTAMLEGMPPEMLSGSPLDLSYAMSLLYSAHLSRDEE